MAHELEPQVTLPWLIRLRWLGVLGQLLALLLAKIAFSLELSYGLLLALAALTACSNLFLTTAKQRLQGRWSPTRVMGAVLVFDTLLLTALLAASGGPMNPLTVFYLVHITLSAVVLSAGWTSFVAAVSIAGFGLLFLVPSGLLPNGGGHHHHQHASHGLDLHLEGMWLAFALAATVTAFFVRRIAQAIAHQREEIATLRESGARNARLASVTTLAAGAAHELGSPLGTIAIAAHDARLALERGESAASVLDDLELILLEVDRCQDVLGQMAGRAQSGEDAQLGSVSELERGVHDYLGDEKAPRVEFRSEGRDAVLGLPRAQTVQSVVALVRNALEASQASSKVVVQIERADAALKIAVVDEGAGIPGELLGKVGEPFFTTKEPGHGLGLGVFLARAFAESRGGSLLIQSTLGSGTRATLLLPSSGAPALPVLA